MFTNRLARLLLAKRQAIVRRQIGSITKDAALLACVGLLSLVSPLAGNASPLLLNGSFETPAVGGTSTNCFNLVGCQAFELGDDIGGWTVFGTGSPSRPIIILSNDYDEGGRGFTAQDGTQSIDLTGASNQGDNGVEQTLTLDPGTYQLSFWVGRQDGNAAPYGGPASVDVLINDTLLGTYGNSLNVVSSDLSWQLFTALFTATGNTTIGFRNASLSSDQNAVQLDNVSIAAVPIPAALPLFVGGLGMMAWLSRRRKSRHH